MIFGGEGGEVGDAELELSTTNGENGTRGCLQASPQCCGIASDRASPSFFPHQWRDFNNTVFLKQKPWVTPDLRTLLQEKRRAGDREELRRVRKDLKWNIKECKASYRRKLEDHLQQNNASKVSLRTG